jgi:hypothetical protein
VVSWVAPVASDNCPGVVLTSSHAPGATFPKGVTTVTYTATDAAGLTATCSFTVTVVDVLRPVITGCPGNITQGTDAGLCSAVVTWTLPLASDNCGIASFVCTYGPGMAFPKGVTVVDCLATDTSGNTAACSFTITVVDDEAPQIGGLSDLDVVLPLGADSASGLDLGIPTVVDNCDTALGATNNAPASYPMGRTLVTWTATDAAGNIGTHEQNVFVSGPSVRVLPVASPGDAAGGGGAAVVFPTFLVMPPPIPPLQFHGAPIAAVVELGTPIRGCFQLENVDPLALGTKRPSIQIWRTDISESGLQSTVYVGAVQAYIVRCGASGEAVVVDRLPVGFELTPLCCAALPAEPFFAFQMATIGEASLGGFTLVPGYYDLTVKIELPGGIYSSPRVRIQVVAPSS